MAAQTLLENGRVCNSFASKTDSSGHYKFSVPRWVYRLVLLPDQAPEPGQKIPRTYYPGVLRASEAARLSAVTDRDGIDLVAEPPHWIPRQFLIEVKHTDGSPAAGESILIEADNTFLDAVPLSGSDGHLFFVGVEDVPYQFEVRSTHPGSSQQPVFVPAGRGPTRVSIPAN